MGRGKDLLGNKRVLRRKNTANTFYFGGARRTPNRAPFLVNSAVSYKVKGFLSSRKHIDINRTLLTFYTEPTIAAGIHFPEAGKNSPVIHHFTLIYVIYDQFPSRALMR